MQAIEAMKAHKQCMQNIIPSDTLGRVQIPGTSGIIQTALQQTTQSSNISKLKSLHLLLQNREKELRQAPRVNSQPKNESTNPK